MVQGRVYKKRRGGDLLYRVAVPSALQGLTAVFGMGTGGAPAQWPPQSKVFTKKKSSLTCSDFAKAKSDKEEVIGNHKGV